jgi:hypothetical protein
VCATDQALVHWVGGQSGAVWLGSASSVVLDRFLRLLAGTHPDMTLRSAVGWALTAANMRGPRLQDIVQPWAEAGLAESGWLFRAAGMSVEEARQVAASADPEQWRTVWLLAALGDDALPVFPEAPCALPLPGTGVTSLRTRIKDRLFDMLPAALTGRS